MSYIYRDDGRLEWIECDECGGKLRPGPHVVNSGWMRYGQDIAPNPERDPSKVMTWDYCPDCWTDVVLGRRD